MTTYPFALSGTLPQRLPPPAHDGRHYLDVRFRGHWDGILVADQDGMCIGVYVGRRVRQHPLPFEPGEIEDVRPASPWNRALAALPGDPWDWAVTTVVVFSPLALAAAQVLWPWLALLPTLACAAALRVLYGAPGFPLARPALGLCGLAQIVIGVVTVAAWGLRLLRHAH